MCWYQLRFNPTIKDIQEQYPLELEQTTYIADLFGVKHPQNRTHIMTTDFLVTYVDGHQEAISLKSSKSVLNKPRTVELLNIEKTYWELKGIPYHLVFKDELNHVYTSNIRMCPYYADKSSVVDERTCLLYMIIHHLITPETFKAAPLNISKELNNYESEVKEYWQKLS